MNIRFDYKGKNALVTGAATGIGREIALQFAKAGANVAVWDFNEAEGQKTVEECQKFGVKSQFYKVDVSCEDLVMATCKQALADFGDIDYLISNAGVGGNPALTTYGEGYTEDMRRIFSINVFGFAYLFQGFIDYFKARKQGKIVATSSIANRIAASILPSYGASKAALSTLVRNAAITMGDYNVNVNSIAPGHVYTPIYHSADVWAKANPGVHDTNVSARQVVENKAKLSALGRMQTEEDMANAVLYLCSDEAQNVTGVELSVDAGFSIR